MGSFPAKTRNSDLDYAVLGLDELSGDEILATPQVVHLLAATLERVIKKNDKSSRKKTSLRVTVFDGLRPPAMSVVQYLERISKYARCSPSCFVVAFVYIERFVRCKNSSITSLNVHRLLVTGVMLAAKFMDDAKLGYRKVSRQHLLRCFNNAYFAKVGGVSTGEMNKLEMELLFSLDFRLNVTLETFDQYCVQLSKEAPGSYQIEWPVQVCGRKGRWSNKEEPKCTQTKFAGYNTCRAV